jgi:hypothetical protein
MGLFGPRRISCLVCRPGLAQINTRTADSPIFHHHNRPWWALLRYPILSLFPERKRRTQVVRQEVPHGSQRGLIGQLISSSRSHGGRWEGGIDQQRWGRRHRRSRAPRRSEVPLVRRRRGKGSLARAASTTRRCSSPAGTTPFASGSPAPSPKVRNPNPTRLESAICWTHIRYSIHKVAAPLFDANLVTPHPKISRVYWWFVVLVPNYVVDEPKEEAMSQGHDLRQFRYGCAGYSMYVDNRDGLGGESDGKTLLPYCRGLEVSLCLLFTVWSSEISYLCFAFLFCQWRDAAAGMSIWSISVNFRV